MRITFTLKITLFLFFQFSDAQNSHIKVPDIPETAPALPSSGSSTTPVVSPHHVFIGRGCTLSKEAQEVKESVEMFVENLKSYMDETGFDVTAFENLSPTLQKEVAELRISADKVMPSEVVSEMLSFAVTLLEAMTCYVKTLKSPNYLDTPGSGLLFNLMELHIRVLVIHNSRGELDHSTPRYMDKLIRYRLQVDQYEREIKTLDGITVDVRLIFDGQVTKVREGLANLNKDISVPNFYCLCHRDSKDCLSF
ncbi:hypothetical protein JCM33374_g2440 [Metschnikowia sp. JCM 33374]|nr:hypothetical protein JCM33374_g2440 [Metschnikowia sp. JCM 33374]